MPGLLAKLVHRSLLSVTHEDGGQARFAQLAPVRAHAYRSLRAADEVELAEDLRDDWCLALAQSRPRLGRVEEAAWYAEIDANLPTVRATLQRRLVVRPDAVGTAINSQLNGFWFYRDQIEEGIRWAEPAQAVTGAGDLDHVLNQFSLGLLLLQQFRGDRGREIIDEALATLAHPRSRPRRPGRRRERLHLGELLLAVSTGFSGDRDAVKMHQLIDVFETIEGLSDRPDLAVGVEALRCLADTVGDPAGTDLERVQDIFDRALGLGNLWAGWFSAASGATLGLVRQDPALGMVWSSRVVTLQARLGAKTALPQVETLGRLPGPRRAIGRSRTDLLGHPPPGSPRRQALAAQSAHLRAAGSVSRHPQHRAVRARLGDRTHAQPGAAHGRRPALRSPGRPGPSWSEIGARPSRIVP